MTDFDAILSAIREAPTDDLRRGILADFLEDDGQNYWPCLAPGLPLSTEEMRESIADPANAFKYELKIQNRDGVELRPLRIMVHRGVATAIIGPIEAVVKYGPQIAMGGCISAMEIDMPHPNLGLNIFTQCYELEPVLGVDLGVSIPERDVVMNEGNLYGLTKMCASAIETAVLATIHRIGGISQPVWPAAETGEYRVIRCHHCGHTMPCLMMGSPMRFEPWCQDCRDRATGGWQVIHGTIIPRWDDGAAEASAMVDEAFLRSPAMRPYTQAEIDMLPTKQELPEFDEDDDDEYY